jgi:hypothetical protein
MIKSLKRHTKVNLIMSRSFEAMVVLAFISLFAISGVAASEKKWMQISSSVAFQSNLDPAKENAQMIRAKNIAIDRMLSSTQQSTDFYSSGYSLGLEDMNKDWDDAQMAWHLLGFYVDCSSKNEGQKKGRKNRVLQEDHKEDEHDKEEEEERNKTCTRYVMYAVVSLH